MPLSTKGTLYEAYTRGLPILVTNDVCGLAWSQAGKKRRGTPAGNSHTNVFPVFKFQSCEVLCTNYLPRGLQTDQSGTTCESRLPAETLRPARWAVKNMYLAGYGLIGLYYLSIAFVLPGHGPRSDFYKMISVQGGDPIFSENR